MSLVHKVWRWAKEALRTVFCIVSLSAIVLEALFIDLLRKRKWSRLFTHPRKTLGTLKHLFFGKMKTRNIYDHVKSEGFEIEVHQVVTRDKFVLTLHRLKSNKCPSPNRGAVFCQHGLLNTSLQFVLNGKHKAIAFRLADEGYDVWLGNSRGNRHSRHHLFLNPHEHDGPFWDWCIDDLMYDVEANVKYILNYTHQPQLVYIGHSQGCTQALAAFSHLPELVPLIRLFVCLSPGAFVKEMNSIWLKGLVNMYTNKPHRYFQLLGRGCFAPPMEFGIRFVPDYLWAYLGQIMFWHLFRWSTWLWDHEWEPLYFQETPSLVSVRNVTQWIQHSSSGRFGYYDYGAEGNRRRYGTESVPDYDLSRVTCPTMVIYGGRDGLIDFEKLVRSLPRVVLAHEIKEYFHMDTLCGANANELVNPLILRHIEQIPVVGVVGSGSPALAESESCSAALASMLAKSQEKEEKSVGDKSRMMVLATADLGGSSCPYRSDHCG